MRANVNMMERMEGLINKVKYKNWDFGFYSDGSYLQIQFWAPCNLDRDNTSPNVVGVDKIQKGRKWLISEHMTDSEIIQTIFLAVKVAEEHEMREQFTFEGQQIFGPHFDVFAVAAAIEDEAITEDRRVG